MGNFAQRVGLVHKLRELAGAKELLDCRRDGLGVDEVVWHGGLEVLDAHPLSNSPLHADKAYAELVLDELAH